MKSQNNAMRKWLCTAVFASLFVSTAVFADSSSSSDNPTACGAVMCLINASTGSNPKECRPYLDAYFTIIKFKDGVFSPSKTLSAREKFLNGCQSSDSNSRSSVNSQYGSSQSGF